MPGNFLHFDYFSSLNAIVITFIFLFVVPSITVLCIFSALNDEDYKELKNKVRKTSWKSFVLYKESGTLYIIKDPKSDNYFVSDNQETVLKAAQGTITPRLYKITFSKEVIKKTIENKVEEFPVVNESEFK